MWLYCDYTPLSLSLYLYLLSSVIGGGYVSALSVSIIKNKHNLIHFFAKNYIIKYKLNAMNVYTHILIYLIM